MGRWVLLLIASIYLFSVNAKGQGRSDIFYIPASKIDHSVLGKTVQLDFYHKSHHGVHLDTIAITLFKQGVHFVEHRKDYADSSWFKDQYLESIDNFNGEKIRIIEFVIDRITQDSFLITCHLQGYVDNKPVGSPKKEKTWLDKKTLVEVLVHEAAK
jgi:hypothetical protein